MPILMCGTPQNHKKGQFTEFDPIPMGATYTWRRFCLFWSDFTPIFGSKQSVQGHLLGQAGSCRHWRGQKCEIRGTPGELPCRTHDLGTALRSSLTCPAGSESREFGRLQPLELESSMIAAWCCARLPGGARPSPCIGPLRVARLE